MSYSDNIRRIADRIDYLDDLLQTYYGTYDLGEAEDLDNSAFFKGISNAVRLQILQKLLAEGYNTREFSRCVTGSNQYTFSETIAEVAVILEALSGYKNTRNYEEEVLDNSSGLYYYNLPLMNSRKNGKFLFDIVVEPFITWMEDTSAKFKQMKSKTKKRVARNDDNDDMMSLTETMKRTKFT